MNATTDSSSDLKSRWKQFRQANPRTRIRDAAAALCTTEAELLATRLGEGVVRLAVDGREDGWGAVILRLPSLGRVMALTRNAYCVHERRGKYREIGLFGSMGNVVGPDIDLRFFLNRWAFGFAVSDEGNDRKARRSLQFFDSAGTAIHKVFLEEESDESGFHAIAAEFRARVQEPPVPNVVAAISPSKLSDSEIDLAGFRAGWAALRDTHEFFGLLRRFEVGRLQALRLIGEEFATPVTPNVAEPLLKAAAAAQLPIMVFVGNPGMIQIHTGTVSRIVPFGEDGEWINVLDTDFNLHLLQNAVASAWIVRKPTRDGHVTSAEIFDADGELIVQFFGKRKPGEPELDAWRALAAELAAEHPAA